MATLSNNKVLVTGLSGFTGKYVKKTLEEEGYEVFPLQSNLTHKLQLKEEISKLQPDYIIHLAGIAFPAYDDTLSMYEVNVLGTENLLDALLNTNVKKVIVASSATVYGNQDTNILHEKLSPHPVNHYGCSKLAMEMMCQNYFEHLPILITRPFNYTGIGQAEHFLIPKIVKHFKEKKQSIELGNTHVSRDFSDVRWVANAYVKLLTCKESSTSVNLCSGEATSLEKIITTLEELAGYDIKVNVNPAFVRKNEIHTLRGDSTKLHSILNDLSGSIQIKETLEWMLYQ